jgi:hypothetical protein
MRKSKPRKTSAQRGATYAEGSDTPMFEEQAANPQKPGRMGHEVKGTAPGSRGPVGGGQRMVSRQAADPGPPGRTGKSQSAASSRQASGGVPPSKPRTEKPEPVGGIARVAKPGQCAP